MFTGLIVDVGTVRSLRATPEGATLVVESMLARELEPGHSVAVSGVCLTARSVEGATFTADVVHETLRRSALGELAADARVNLELPLRAHDRLGGHVVGGHVDGHGTVSARRTEGASVLLTVAVEPRLMRYVVEKGSIALDGVSLTVAGVDEDELDVVLIPETLSRTTLGTAEPGVRVNLEVDILAKYVESLAPAGATAR